MLSITSLSRTSPARPAFPDTEPGELHCTSMTTVATIHSGSSYTLRELSQMAGEALDELVVELIEGQPHIPGAFFDWMGIDASLMVMMSLENLQAMPRFQASLQLSDDPMPAMRRWVRHWVCPHLIARFNTMADVFPEFQISQPQSLQEAGRSRVN